MLPAKTRAFLKRLPKAEIHLHFEGAIGAGTILSLGRKYNIPTIRRRRDAEKALQFSTATEFFHQFLFVSSLLREPEDFYYAAKDLNTRLNEENIRYAEITFAPHKFMRAGVDYLPMIKALDRGLNGEPAQEFRRRRFLIDIVRDLGPEMGMEMIETVKCFPHPSVIGIALGGSEQFPAQDSAAIYEFAASIGLRKTAHAGEGRGAESIWSALKTLHPERIDHGVRANEDPTLMAYLAENKIPLNQCLTSNVTLGVVTSHEAHPFQEYYKRGIPITIGTDDPAFFQSTLSEELEKLILYQGIPIHQIPKIIANAIHAAFLSEEEKESMLAEFERETQGLTQEFNLESEK